jgi:DNA-binding PucR family transcriptional regulator
MKISASELQPELPVCEEALHEQIISYLEQAESVEALSDLVRKVEALPGSHLRRASLLRTVGRAIALAKKFEQHQQSERRLRAVFDSAQSLTELKNLHEVLFEIVERGRRLLASDLAWLAAVNPADGHWQVLAVDGTHTKDIQEMCPPVTTGVAGFVLKTRGPFTTMDYLHDQRFDHSPSIDASIAAEGLQSVVAVPLLSNAEVVGILIVGDRYRRTHLPWEISTLAALAAHASVAVRNARAFELTRNALKETEEANRLLQEQTAALEFAADAHERMAKLLAKGGGLRELINLVTEILGGQVMFLDAAGIELCVATPVGYELPEVGGLEKVVSGIDAGIQSAVGQSRMAGRSVPTATVSHSCCRVAAVMSGDELLGSLVIHTRVPLSEQAIRIFERSATATAVLRLSAEKKSASVYQKINLAVRALLQPALHGDRGILDEVEQLGIDFSAPVSIAMASIEQAKLGYGVRRLTERFRGMPFLATDIDNAIIVLANRSDVDRFASELESLLFGELFLPGVAVVSGPHGGGDLASTLAPLKRSVKLLRALGRENCVVQEAQLRMYAVIFQNHDADQLNEVLESIIGPLVRHDAQKGTRLVETLQAYLDHMQNARLTASSLGIHVNTMHNRLEAISNLLGRWNSEGRVAEIYVALRLRQLKQTVQPLRGA